MRFKFQDLQMNFWGNTTISIHPHIIYSYFKVTLVGMNSSKCLLSGPVQEKLPDHHPKGSQKGRRLAQRFRHHMGFPPAIKECLGSSPSSTSDASFLLIYTLRGSN